MLAELNQQLAAVKASLRERLRLHDQLLALEGQLEEERARLTELGDQVAEGTAKAARLQGWSLSALWYAVTGDRELRAKQAQEELGNAQLGRDRCEQVVGALEAELEGLRRQVADFPDLEGQLAAALAEKERLLVESGGEKGRHLVQLAQDEAQASSHAAGLTQAVDAGRALLTGLAGVVESLDSASRWGTWDLMGGGALSTAVKHSRLDAAREKLGRIQADLGRFQQELADVAAEADLALEIDAFARLADIAFDNLITDWMVQSRIRGSLAQVRQVQSRVQAMLSDLQREAAKAQARMVATQERRRNLVERA